MKLKTQRSSVLNFVRFQIVMHKYSDNWFIGLFYARLCHIDNFDIYEE